MMLVIEQMQGFELKNQLNFSFQTDFKNEQDTFNWFIS